jgi:hypothetical protein
VEVHVLKLVYLLIIGSFIVANASNNYGVVPDDEKVCLITSWDSLREASQLTEFKKDTRTHWVLSLDGDGLDGILNLQALVSLESLTKKSVVDLFDGIVATSFSSIVACLITLPDPDNPSRPKYSAQAASDIITDGIDEMFKTNYLSFCGLFGNYYRTGPFKTFLKDIFDRNNYKNSLLPTALVTHDLNTGKALVFATTDAHDFYTKDLVMAATAFPKCYEPQKVKPIGSEVSYLLGDGCTAMNNPTAAGVALLQKHYGVGFEDIRVLSLGRTRGVLQVVPSLLSGGNLSWMKEIVNLYINGQTNATENAAKSFLGENYYRFDIYLGPSLFFTDAASKADAYTQNKICDFEAVAEKLKTLAEEYGENRVREQSKGRVVKRYKSSSRQCVLQWMDSILP